MLTAVPASRTTFSGGRNGPSKRSSPSTQHVRSGFWVTAFLDNRCSILLGHSPPQPASLVPLSITFRDSVCLSQDLLLLPPRSPAPSPPGGASRLVASKSPNQYRLHADLQVDEHLTYRLTDPRVMILPHGISSYCLNEQTHQATRHRRRSAEEHGHTTPFKSSSGTG